jgi:AAA domain
MTAENVHSLYVPDANAMRQHLEHLFGGYLDGCHDGLIELAWTDTKPNKDGRYALRNAMMFGTDQIEELIEEAARLNSQPNCNVYIGAALRKPGTFPGTRANHNDVLALTCLYVDLDDEGAAIAAKNRYGAAKPTKVVVTGREPYTRAQMWWRLDEPIIDPALSEALLKGMAAALGGDPSVTDAARLMRLAGTIAWPMKPDRKRPELTFIAPLKESGQPVYMVGHLARLFPRVYDATVDGVKFQDDDGVTRGTNAFGMEDKVEDGRERYMLKTAAAVLIQLIGETGKAPTAQELFDASWEQYQRGTDFTRPGRGQKEYASKCVYTVKRFHEGKIRGCETIEIVQALYQQKQQARGSSGEEARGRDYSDEFAKSRDDAEQQAKTNPASQYEYQDVRQIKNRPDPTWLVDELVIERSLGFIYGPPGCLKTFIALDMALSFTTGQAQWWGRLIARKGAVIYISSEGLANLKFRIMAWERHRKVVADDAPFYLIQQSINFMRSDDIGTLLATVDTIAAKSGEPIAAVFVDTVSRVLPGAEENLQRDMTLFVEACTAVRERCGTVVFGIHHTNKNGEFRGSTVMPGAGDFMIEVRREPGAVAGSIFAKKIKDGEDGWEQHFKVEKLTVGDFGSNTSLVVDPVDVQPSRDEGSSWPSREVCKEILAGIHEQWLRGKPWCHAPNSSRAAVANIAKRWNLKREVVTDILTSWTARGIIEEDTFDTKNHIRGYRKLLDL